MKLTKKDPAFFFFLNIWLAGSLLMGAGLRDCSAFFAVELAPGRRASAAAAREAPRLWDIRLSGCGGVGLVHGMRIFPLIRD